MFPKTYWMEASRILLNTVAALACLLMCVKYDLPVAMFAGIFVTFVWMAASAGSVTDDIRRGEMGKIKYWATCSLDVPFYEIVCSLLTAMTFAVLMATPFPALGVMGLLLFMCNGTMSVFAFWAMAVGMRHRRQLLRRTAL